MNYTNIRHQLHQLAEPSGAEVATQQFIMDTLAGFEPTHIHVFKNSKNLLAVYDFGPGGETTLIRGDFDAVRVPETLDLSYASHTPGVAHKCGHDGHATILLGLAEQLHLHPLAKGRVLLFFQAAEETGEGAAQLLETDILEQYKPSKMSEIDEALTVMTDKLNAAENQEPDQNTGSFIVNRAISYIEKHYTEKLTLQEVADICYVSQWHLSKLLNKYAEQGFYDILNRVRIDAAKELLKDPSLRIGDIGMMVGYTDNAHFARIFKKITGCSANEYRNRL